MKEAPDNSHITVLYAELVLLAEKVAGMTDEYNVSVDELNQLYVPELRLVPYKEALANQEAEKRSHLLLGVSRRKWEVFRLDRWTAQPRTNAVDNESDGGGIQDSTSGE